MYTLQGGQGHQQLSKQAWSSDMMALDGSCFLFPNQPCFDCWDPHSFGGGGDLHGLTLTPLEMESSSSSEASTGYLQDAVVGWSERCKRRRTVSSSTDDSTVAEYLPDLQGFRDSKWHEDPSENLSCVVKDDNNIVTDNTRRTSMVPTESNNITQQKKTAPQLQQRSEARGAWRPSLVICTPKEEEDHRERRKKAMGVVYPFVVVKPGGIEGDMTLTDINKRILMRPTRPVHHPVGEFACGPCVSGADGPGLSGKAVVGLTRIHTQGRGTITIIRTRG